MSAFRDATSLRIFACREAATLRRSQDRCAGGVHARPDWCYLSHVVCFLVFRFLHPNIASVCAAIFAEGVVGIRRARIDRHALASQRGTDLVLKKRCADLSVVRQRSQAVSRTVGVDYPCIRHEIGHVRNNNRLKLNNRVGSNHYIDV